jgi:hypothetical protein
MAKHSRLENERRAAEHARIKEIEAAWLGSLPKPVHEAFVTAVTSARNRPPAPPAPNMAPGTRPNPPKFEPRPSKKTDDRRGSRS